MSDHNRTSADANDELLLPGLDGTNPLGFLAALGVLQLVTSESPTAQLVWKPARGTWRPCLLGVDNTCERLGERLHELVQRQDRSAWEIDKKLPFEAEKLRTASTKAVKEGNASQRLSLDLLAAFGVEAVREVKKSGKGDQKAEVQVFQDTSLRLVRSADNKKDKDKQEGFLTFAKKTLESCSAEQLDRAIRCEWQYKDKGLTFRWDPAEDRGYALQWDDPSPVGALTERGANCLALFALPFFPTVPVNNLVETTGFVFSESKQESLTWPIWDRPATMCVIRSLLCLKQLEQEQPKTSDLHSMGIAAAYRCNRVMTSKYYANFTPAQRIA